ncbi:AraC family transcriptional regulator [uncultured Kordia sp.]|uniref:helix-turn-helix domain-containing protein n=1 Tax=uncultured Kordia sp. TaxID=507699 RepID=UPI0026345F2F|nr:AraC family transcriptional regulator [uncultured Kordia sp.]
MNIQTITLFGKPVINLLEITELLELPASMPEDEAGFVYILEGRCKNFTELKEFDLKQGEAVLAKSGNGVFKTIMHQNKPNFKSISIRFHKSVLEQLYKDSPSVFYENRNTPLNTNNAAIENNVLLKQYATNLLTYFNHKELVTEELLIIKLKELIVLLLSFEEKTQVREIMFNLFTEKNFKFQQIIQSHIFSDISIENLAQLTNRSLSTFKRDFKRIYNNTPLNYIIEQRIEKVASLLIHSQDTISNIAYDCEFKTLAHMSRVFKKKYGSSPTDYRLSFSDKR